MGATRVVAEHASQVGAAARRHIRTEHQPLSSQTGIQLVEDDARFDTGPAACSIDLENPVHVSGEIDLQALSDRLSCQAGTASTGQQRQSALTGDTHRVHDVRRRPGKDYSHRFYFINAGVRGVEAPGQGVKTDITFHPRGERMCEIIAIFQENKALSVFLAAARRLFCS